MAPPRKTTEVFVAEATKLHNGKYIYNRTTYLKSGEKLTVGCPHHGEFQIEANSHLKGAGCGKCAKKALAKKLRGDPDEFIVKCRQMHNDKYDYSKTRYVDATTKVTMTCSQHGDFTVYPHNVLTKGSGCIGCAKHGFQTTRAGTLYVLHGGSVTKVGITNRAVSERVRSISESSGICFDIVFTLHAKGHQVKQLEEAALAWMKLNGEPVNRKFDGYTECFTEIPPDKLVDFITTLPY